MFVFSDQESNCFKIVKMILERKFAPVIVFSFSKKDCEAYAMQMTKLDFNTGRSLFTIEQTKYNFIQGSHRLEKYLNLEGFLEIP